MIKKISKIIFLLLYFFDFIILKLFKRSFLVWFKDFYEKRSYKIVNLKKNDEKLVFFTPNYLTSWLVEDFFNKEPETIEWIDNFEKNDEKIIFWDIGSNIGLYSIYAAKLHKSIDVISFEPSTNNLRVLSKNIFINKLTNKIKIFQLPLSDKKFGFAEFKESQFIEGSSHNCFYYDMDFEGKKIDTKNKYNIFGTSINHLLDNNILDVPTYIKIDVDGIEHLILKGADSYLLNKKIKSIQIEINENYKDNFEMAVNLLSKNGFKFKEKKRNDNLKIYKDKKFLNTFNYYFYR